MPDRYGQVTGEDFLALGLGFQKIGEMRDKRQVGLGLDALTADPNAAQPEGVSGDNWAQAQTRFGQAQQGRLAGREAALDLEATKRMDTILAQAGGDPVSYLNNFEPRDSADLLAAARLSGAMEKNEKTKGSIFKTRLETGARQGQELMQSVRQARTLLDSGEQEKAGLMLEGASNTALTRWRYKYNPETQQMDRLHLSREEGWAPTGESIPVSEALGQAEKMTIQDYAMGVAGEMAATSEFNRKTIESGGQYAVGSKGEELRVYPQISLRDFGGISYLVTDAKTNKVLGGFSQESFAQSGVRMEPRPKSGGQAKGQPSAFEDALAYYKKMQATAAKDELATAEEVEEKATSLTNDYLRTAYGEGVTLDTLRKQARQPQGGAAQPAGGGKQGGQDAETERPPDAAFKGMKPGQARTFRNSKTGEEQTWIMDRVTGQLVLQKPRGK